MHITNTLMQTSNTVRIVLNTCKKSKKRSIDCRYGMSEPYMYDLPIRVRHSHVCIEHSIYKHVCTFWIKHFSKMEHFNQHQFLLQRNPIAGVHYLLVLQRLFALYLG